MNDTISRQAVADAINGIECTRHTTWYEFYQKVMTAVEKLPPAELGTNLAEVGTDYISRQAAIDTIEDFPHGDVWNVESMEEMVDRIKQLPSADEPSQVARDIARIVENEQDMRVIAQSENRTETHACDSISRQAAMDAINGIECTRQTTWYEFYQKVITAVGKLPPAQPEIIYCKDCVKHNKRIGDYETKPDGTYDWIWKPDACPLAEFRGVAQGHEFDYQFCAYGERRME